jgi:hypothetical protein
LLPEPSIHKELQGDVDMESREDLTKRVAHLEQHLSAVQGTVCRGVRKRSEFRLGELPLYEIALGPDPEHGEIRGHAKAIVAIGDLATGFLAIGGVARGFVAVGGLAAGLLSFGGLSIGVLAAIGGLAIGGLAFGGGAIGGVAIGGAAAGQYACGGGAVGRHIISATERDPVAEQFFVEHGLDRFCGSSMR